MARPKFLDKDNLEEIRSDLAEEFSIDGDDITDCKTFEVTIKLSYMGESENLELLLIKYKGEWVVIHPEPDFIF